MHLRHRIPIAEINGSDQVLFIKERVGHMPKSYIVNTNKSNNPQNETENHFYFAINIYYSLVISTLPL
jgi:hypothetical protein